MKEWLNRWEFYYFGFFALLIGLFLYSVIRQTKEENARIYTMVVDIYYTDTPERHTYVSDGLPIIYRSVRGTNYVTGNGIGISTTAPIKVISNTYREKK